MPWPIGLVVKNGSKTFSRVSGDMPTPVSPTQTTDVVAGVDLLLAEPLLRLDDLVGRGDRERAALGHRIAGVDREVQDRILELVGIRQRRARPRGQVDRKPDLLAQRPAQQLLHAADQLIDVDRLGIERLAPGERQQPMRQRRARDWPQPMAPSMKLWTSS